MLIFDDKYFVEMEAYISFTSGTLLTIDLTNTVLLEKTNYTIFDDKDYYCCVDDVHEILNLIFDWRMNRGFFENDTVDILDKRHWWMFRSYKTIERIKKGVFNEG